MKKLVMLVIGVGLLCLPATAFAFHDAGVAHCNGCHTMHNSEDGALVDGDSPNGNPYLLTDATPSDVCLSCHGSRLGAVFGADVMAPPREIGSGNFVFLLEDNLNDGHGGGDVDSLGAWTHAIDGDAAGHNLVAPSRGVGADGTLLSAPGGTFPASLMGCTSCHDPHGNENFRLLYGAGRSPQAGVPGVAFLNAAPDAEGGPSIFFGGGESNSNHTAYKAGMSGWCGNCHGDYHQNNTKLIHKSGVLMNTTAVTYNLYNGTDDILGGTQPTAYLAAVPFEDAANTSSSTAGPSAASTVMCLSCHRAHASSAPNAGRWDFNTTIWSEDGVESGSYAIPNAYANPTQRSLCNKCHAKDVDDHFTP